MTATFCPRCQTPQRPRAKFCRACGVPLAESSARSGSSQEAIVAGAPLVEIALAHGASSPEERSASRAHVVTPPWEEQEWPSSVRALSPAPVLMRLLAFFCDLVLLLGVVAVVIVGLVALRGPLLLVELAQWGTLAAGLVVLVNHIILCSVRGRSVGMALAGIKLVRADGRRISWGRSLVRHTLGYGLAALSLGLGFLWMLWDEKKRGWHDRLSGTWVVKEAGHD